MYGNNIFLSFKDLHSRSRFLISQARESIKGKVNDLQNKLEELQIKYSFQEDWLQKLNEIIVNQQKELALIKSEIQGLKEELIILQANQETAQSIDIKIEKPPHY